MFNGTMIKRMVRVQVKLDPSALVVEDGIPTPIGYYQVIGCTARDVKTLITKFVCTSPRT